MRRGSIEQRRQLRLQEARAQAHHMLFPRELVAAVRAGDEARTFALVSAHIAYGGKLPDFATAYFLHARHTNQLADRLELVEVLRHVLVNVEAAA